MARKRRERGWPPSRKPHFFKVLLGDYAQRLRIPPKFMKHISKEASKATLQGPNGRSWHVELGRNVRGTFLLSGWSSFVSYHSMREHDFLVFRYDGDMHFTVMIFDTSACEREDVLTTKSSRKLFLSEGKDELSRPVAQVLDVGFLFQKNTSRNEGPKLLLNDMHMPKELARRKIPSHKSNKHAKTRIEDDATPICMVRPYTKCHEQYSSRRRLVTEQERSKAQEAANSFSSILPYFISRMTPTKVYKRYVLTVPRPFSREHLPRRRTNLVLRDPCGKAWVVGYTPNPAKNQLWCSGWAAFVRGNNLEEGDFCAFELAGPVELRVSIFRVV